MKQAQYNIPIFEDQDMANLNDYSEKMASAIKTQIDKFGNPLVFKGIVNTLDELNSIKDNTNGDIYSVAEENKNYIWNGTAWEIYSDSTKIEAEAIVQEIVDKLKNSNNNVYGVRRNIESSNTTWERIKNSIGLTASATHDGTGVHNDFDNIYPWSDIVSCDVSADGTINSYYGEPGFSFENPIGYIMTSFPEFWWKRVQEAGYEYIYIAPKEQEGFIKSEPFMLSRYAVGEENSILNSKSGVIATEGDIEDIRRRAKEINNNWYLLDITRWSMVQLLYLVEYADYDSRKVLGKGIGTSGANGNCDDLGMKSGCKVDDGTGSVIYRGIENIFKNGHQFCDGIVILNGKGWISRNPENNTFTGYPVAADIKTSFNELLYETGSMARGWVSKVGYDENNPEIQLPIETKGSSSSHTAGYYYSSDNDSIITIGNSGRGEPSMWTMTAQRTSNNNCYFRLLHI